MIQKYFFFLALFLSSNINATENPATAFYYASNPPLDLLSAYDRVVVEPENISAEQLQYMQKRGVIVYAYLSIGEVGTDRTWYDQIEQEWTLGINASWNSVVMDMASTGWHSFLLDKKIKKLWKQGYRGFFLDTMDSYQLFSKTEAAKNKQQKGMVKLLKSMKKQYKDIHLLFNRGFEILDQAASLSDGLVAESLFSGWNPDRKKYITVNEKDRKWLLSKLKQAREDYSLPVVVIDYLPPEQREKAEKVADKIRQEGFIPWVSKPELDYMGVGNRKLIPRKVLFLYDSREEQLTFSPIHRFLAMPLEYLGYIPDYRDIAEGLPKEILKGRYAGIVAWFSGSNPARDNPFADWVSQQVNHKLPIAFLGQFTLAHHQQLTRLLKLDYYKQNLIPPLKLNIQSKQMGFEARPVVRHIGLPLVKSKIGDAWLKVVDSNKNEITPVFISKWGGVALNPYILQTIPSLGNDNGFSRWIINPFEFLKAALQLKEIPVPDATTENGNRILTIHIDGDGFYNKSQLSGGRYSAELILDEFLKPHSLPHTVSVVEAEIGVAGLNPMLSPILEPLARKIFKLPNVELASHSFSHPFNWNQAAISAKKKNGNKTALNYEIPNNALIAGHTYTELNKTIFNYDDGFYHLPIPNYSYSAKREIKGSIDYINQTLAPIDKKTKVFLWTGDSLPNEEALAWTSKAQVTNMNGGSTIIRNGINSMTNVSSNGIVRGAYFQVYAPIQNENVFTNDWSGPFFGYQRVIETFKLTNEPKRLKPISIYYHFYSGERQASLRALHRVYDWTLKQETLPLWLSEYIPRVNAFRHVVYEKIKNGWQIYHAKDLRTLRISNQIGQPDIIKSTGVAGYRNLSQGQYIALNGTNKVTLSTTEKPISTPYLVKSNARIQYWLSTDKFTDFRLMGHQPITFSLANFSYQCVLMDDFGNFIKGIKQSNFNTLFKFSALDTGGLQVICEK
ncbi:MAG: bifunctional glycoside hydrolase 114/ polysaccharide deacetylase family protein [Methylococcales bacterium]|nr:bifunctional glycoside hydrolase 114/ polysaccharide deacetylase family protein [Methylococcales bacterium]